MADSPEVGAETAVIEEVSVAALREEAAVYEIWDTEEAFEKTTEGEVAVDTGRAAEDTAVYEAVEEAVEVGAAVDKVAGSDEAVVLVEGILHPSITPPA